MERIAILHYTLAPEIGGVEALIERQVESLTQLGYPVRLLSATNSVQGSAQMHTIAALHPSSSAVIAASRHLLPREELSEGHPLVQRISAELEAGLEGCKQCWVHNAFTVHLNPFLTLALWQLARTRPDIRWVAWCEDISSITAFWKGPSLAARVQPALVAFVTISDARKRELEQLLGVDADDIRVIRPPLSATEWLGIGPDAERLMSSCHLDSADPVILVPAKLLPHKNLPRIVGLAFALKARGLKPAALVTAASSSHEPAASHMVREELHNLARTKGVEDSVFLMDEVLGHPPARATVRDLMLLSDIVFVSSAEEGFGIPLREAAMLRVPVLCSDILTFRESAAAGTRFFPLHASDCEIAELAAVMTAVAPNRSRREAVDSLSCFRDDLKRLASGARVGIRT